MWRLFAMTLALAAANAAHAHPQLLYNGDFEFDTPTFFYYDNNTGNTGTALDVPGWEAFANADPSSWVQVSEDTPTVPGDWVLNLSGSDVTGPGFVGLAGIKTAVANRPAVTPGQLYHATVTYDNYFAPAGISYFIDWFGGGGAPLGSTGGLLADPNGPLGFDPHNQLLQIVGAAPAGAATAGVRFESANGGFAGATADNFHFGLIPEPGTATLAVLGGLAIFGIGSRRNAGRGRRRADL